MCDKNSRLFESTAFFEFEFEFWRERHSWQATKYFYFSVQRLKICGIGQNYKTFNEILWYYTIISYHFFKF